MPVDNSDLERWRSLERLRLDAAKLASINLTLLSKLAVYEETTKGKVVSFATPTIPSR